MSRKVRPFLSHHAPGVVAPCALVRVSTDEQGDKFSLPEQTYRIRQHCEQQLGVAVPDAAMFVEDGVSGRPGTLARRPGLKAALDACLSGQYTHLVVHKLDRLGRNVGLVSSVLETLEEHGIVFVSVQDKVDASTAAGRLYIAIFVAIAQWYSDNLSEETRKGKAGRKRAGLYNGILPFGAMRGEGVNALPLPDLRPLLLVGSDGIVRHTTKHEGLLLAFEWCGQGLSAREIAVKLNSVGYRTQGTWGSNPFSKDTIQRLLGNRFYVGELPDGRGGWVPGKHEPLVPQELWERAQAARRRGQLNPQTIPGNARVHILGGGLLRCAVCWSQGRSSALHITKSRKEQDTASFACYARFQGFDCAQPSFPERVLEAQVTRFFAAFRLPEDYQQRIIDLYARAHEQSTEESGAEVDAVQRRAQLEARLERQQQLYELGDWTRERYLQARQTVLAEVAALEAAATERQPVRDLEALGRLGAYVAAVQAAWADADKPQRRLLVRTLFEQLWVLGDRIVAVKPAAQFTPFFRLAQSTVSRGEGDAGLQLLFVDVTADPEVETVGTIADEIARDGLRHGREEARVQRGGPDGRQRHIKQVAQVA
jgi:DNA invertase Pin-like site-specific DNA recombinase